MIWVRKLFGIILIAVALVLVASILITAPRIIEYFNALLYCISEGCNNDSIKDSLFGIITYLFMAFMVFYLGRRGFLMILPVSSDETIPNSILDEADYSHSKEETNYFQTKYGYCHILEDRIIFANTKTLEDISVYREGNKVIAAFIIQLIVICAMLYYINTHSEDAELQRLFAPVLVVIFSIVSFLASLRNSTTPLIMLDKIISVNYIKGIPYLITPHLIIWFYDIKNRKRKRLIYFADKSGKNISEALHLLRNASLID